MSWLSKHLGIHIGSGPVMPNIQAPPGMTPEEQQAYDEFVQSLGGTIGSAQRMNTGAMALAGTTIGAEALGGAGGAAGSAAGSGGAGGVLGAIKNYGGDVLGFLKDHGGDIAQAGAIADAVYRQQQADKYAKQALGTAEDAYNAKAPLRSAGIAGMLQAGAANPFAKGALPLASNPANATPGAGLPFPPQATNWPKVPFTNLPFDPSLPRGASALPMAPSPAKGV